MKKIVNKLLVLILLQPLQSCNSIVGPKESQGPLAKYFDLTLDDEFWGEKTWEKAESKIIKENVNALVTKSGISYK